MSYNKYTIIGDVHGRSNWRNIVEIENDSNKIIFLGDYVSTHDLNITPDNQIEELYGILDYKEHNKDKVILLRGNHDDEALGYHWAECYPKVPVEVARYMQTKDVSNWFLSNTQWVYQIPDTNIVCSHAGISKRFFENVCKHLKTNSNDIMNINKIEPCELFGFTPCKLSDHNGDSATQPCTWIRPHSLLNHGLKEIIHVVGHTPVKKVCNIKEFELAYADQEESECTNNYCNVWACDCLNDNQYLVIEVIDGEAKFLPKIINFID